MTDLDLPTNEETHILCSTAISRFSPHCAILRMLPTATLLEGENYLLQALAALGATLNNSAYREALWVHANRTLTTILSIKNSKLRDFRAHAAVGLAQSPFNCRCCTPTLTVIVAASRNSCFHEQ